MLIAMKYLKNVWCFGYLVYLCTIKKHDYIYISEIFSVTKHITSVLSSTGQISSNGWFS